MLAALEPPRAPGADGVLGSAPRDSRVPLQLSAPLPWLRMLPNNDPEAPRLLHGASGMRVPLGAPTGTGTGPPPSLWALANATRSRAGGARGAAAAARAAGGGASRCGVRTSLGCSEAVFSAIPVAVMATELSKSSRSGQALWAAGARWAAVGLAGPELVAQDDTDRVASTVRSAAPL